MRNHISAKAPAAFGLHTGSAWFLFSVLTAALLPGRPAHAHPPNATYPYSITVENEHGTPLRTFDHDGERFVLGDHGLRYTIVLRNHSPRRVEAVVSVDGRDVVSGRVGDFVRERGYVLAAYATLRIDGFRKSFSEVAAFRFSTPESSYSARMGTPENVGVIGAAFFPERVRAQPGPRPLATPAPRDEQARHVDKSSARSRASEAQAAPSRSLADDREASAPAAPSVNNLGTEYGESRESHVEEVRFVRASPSRPAVVSLVRYDNAAGLTARGIELEPRHVSYREPAAFPRNRFAPPPP